MPKPTSNAQHILKSLNRTYSSDVSNDINNGINRQKQRMPNQNQPLEEDSVLTLSHYLKTVEMVVKETFNQPIWIKAEIRNLSSKSGHYYFELAEKDDSGKIIASCRGNLWRYQAERVLKKFARATGMQLARDLTVMLKVTATLHPQYGFSLTIADIDPNYTAGDLARQYTAMLDKLIGEGLTQTNKSHPIPLDLQHIVVIAPERAAGLGDFRAEADQLQNHNACQFHYHYATFQGNHAPAEIRQAIKNSLKTFTNNHQQLPDIIVIIRGGGAVGDLAYLNDYELAALIAEQPIPVWVGIGHERDRVLLDEVAHSSFDTPSKVSNAIVNHLRRLVTDTQSHMNTIEKLSKQQLQLANIENQRLIHHIKASSISQLTNQQKDSEHAMHSIQQQVKRHLHQAKQHTEQYLDNIGRQSQQAITRSKIAVQHYVQNIHAHSTAQLRQANEQSTHAFLHTKQLAYHQIVQAQKDSDYLREIILLQHPKRILNQGYAIVENQQTGKVVTSIHQLQTQQTVNLLLHDGKVEAKIN